jgi:hypothetical protein
MANFEQALVEELRLRLVNIFPLVAPEGVLAPYVVYKSSYGERDRSFEGYTASREIDVALHIVAGNYSDLKINENTILDALLLLEGRKMGTALIPVQSVTYDQPDEMVDPVTKENHCIIEMKFRIGG